MTYVGTYFSSGLSAKSLLCIPTFLLSSSRYWNNICRACLSRECGNSVLLEKTERYSRGRERLIADCQGKRVERKMEIERGSKMAEN